MGSKKLFKETIKKIAVSTRMVNGNQIRQTVRLTFESGKVFSKTEIIHSINSSTWYEDLNIGDVVGVTYGRDGVMKKVVRLHS